MANIGFRYPWIAKFDKATGTYSNGFKCGEGMQINITPNYSEASLYGDDRLVEYEKSFTDATISLGVTTLPIVAASVMFGHTVNEKKVVYKATDEANNIGLGYLSVEKEDGETKYAANIICCAKFADSNGQCNTKGESLTFNTPTVEGKAVAVSDGTWRTVEIFDTEEAAVSTIKEYLNITENTGD